MPCTKSRYADTEQSLWEVINLCIWYEKHGADDVGVEGLQKESYRSARDGARNFVNGGLIRQLLATRRATRHLRSLGTFWSTYLVTVLMTAGAFCRQKLDDNHYERSPS